MNERIHRLRNLGEPVPTIEEKIIRLDGTIVDVEVVAAPFFDQGINSIHVVLQDITERKKVRERLEKISNCLIRMGPDFDKNINELTALCGELLGATCALYNSLEGNLLCSIGQWQTPPDYKRQDRPEGHICYDVIQQGGDHSLVINNLPQTTYLSTDPNVAKYGLKTYMGHVVYCAGKPAGSLCVVYKDDVKPTVDDKRIIGILASYIGTEVGRKCAVEALSVSELKYRRLFETAQDGILILDGETGMVIDVNPFLINMLGYSLEQFKGKEVWELGFLKDAIANRGKFLELQENGYVRYENLPLETSSGQRRNVEFVSNLYIVDHKKVIQCNIRDITERKKAEEALSIERNKLAKIAGAVPGVICSLRLRSDGSLNIPYISPVSEDVNGFKPEDVEQDSSKLLALIHQDDLGSVNKSIVESARTMTPWRKEFRYNHPQKGEIWIEGHSIPQREEDGSTLWHGILIDITERKHMEAELIKAHKLDSLGVLAGGIAHDFNNILTGIVGNISMVRHNIDPDGKNFEVLNEAEKAVFQAKDLTRQLLTFAKGGIPIKKVILLSDVLTESAVFTTRGTKVKCKFKIAPNVRFVHVDPGQISQVISNIVINAVQAMPEGGEVNITAENLNISDDSSIPLKRGEYVRVIIKDQGCGIPPQHLLKIFDPYFTTKQAGSGLGLATSYSIVKNHEGCITVDSELGQGASFSIYLPAFMGKAEAVQEELSKGLKMGHGRILLMDDEKVINDVAIKILTKIGYTAEAVTNGAQAIERYTQTYGTDKAFDAVILDLTIPGGKGGKETIAELREINPDIKAIVSSGYSHDPVMANYEFYGFSSVLQKPYRIEEISQILHTLLYKESKNN
jgi:PAS domain S-box-containing protein